MEVIRVAVLRGLQGLEVTSKGLLPKLAEDL